RENFIEWLIQEYPENFQQETTSISHGTRYKLTLNGFHSFTGFGLSLAGCKFKVLDALYCLLEALSSKYVAPKSVILGLLQSPEMEPPVFTRNHWLNLTRCAC